MKIKKTLRLTALVLMICLASMVPFPIRLTQKHNLPENLIENVEVKDDEEEDDIFKGIF